MLNETRLIIATKAMGLHKEQTFMLTDLSPNYEQTHRRFFHLYINPLLFTAVMLILAWWLIRQNSEFAIVPIILAFIFFWHAFEGFRPIEATVFRNTDGANLIEIYKPRKATLGKIAKSKNIYQPRELSIDYEEFVTTLSDRIKANAGLNKGTGCGF